MYVFKISYCDIKAIYIKWEEAISREGEVS